MRRPYDINPKSIIENPELPLALYPWAMAHIALRSKASFPRFLRRNADSTPKNRPFFPFSWSKNQLIRLA
jgi:hypothetical protein